MRTRRILLAAMGVVVALAAGAAQEGHPLVGTWAGEWQVGPDRSVRVTLVMNWDGQTISGVINPGPEAIRLTRVTPDWARWTVSIEAGDPAAASAPRVRLEGRIEDIGSTHRRIVGTWTQDGQRGAVMLTRE